MGNELVEISAAGVPVATGQPSTLPAMVERAGAAGRFAWNEFFFAEHHNPHTQASYMRAVKRFLAWADGQKKSEEIGVNSEEIGVNSFFLPQ